MAETFKIMQVTGQAFNDVGRVMKALPLWSAYAALVTLAFLAGSLDLDMSDPRSLVLNVLIDVAIAPFSIAVMRFTILGETGQETDRKSARHRLFYYVIASVIIAFLTSGGLLFASATDSVVANVVAAIVFITSFILVATFFPAIAIDPTMPRLTCSVREVLSLFFRMTACLSLIFITTIVPIMIVAMFLPFLELLILTVAIFVANVAVLSLWAQAFLWVRREHHNPSFTTTHPVNRSI